MTPTRMCIDGHLDLAYLAMQGVDMESPSPDRDRFGVNLPALKAGGVGLCLATIFTERGADAPWGYPADDDGSAAARAGRLQLRVYQGMEARGAIRETADAFHVMGRTRVHRRSAIDLGPRPRSDGEAFALALAQKKINRRRGAEIGLEHLDQKIA